MKRYLLIVVALLIIFSTNVTASEPAGREGVETVMDYLHVFPSELGLFDEIPYSVIKHINAQIQYGYNNWRVPTNEELSLLRANNYLRTNVTYLSNSKPLGIVLLVSDGQDYLTTLKENGETPWADLGLPSGVKWKKWNEEGEFYTYDQAMAKFGNSLPTKEQLEELKNSCRWTWNGSGYNVEGPSGEFIVLPAAGDHGWGDGSVRGVGSLGRYWCSTLYPDYHGFAWYLLLNSSEVHIYQYDRMYYKSVRLVKRE